MTTKRKTVTATLTFVCASLALAADDAHKKMIDDSVKRGVDVTYTKGATKIDVGPKKGQKKSFSIAQSNTGGILKITLVHVGGSDFGRQASLEYNTPKKTLVIAVAGKQLAVVINPDNTVTAGGTTCPGTDPKCMADAVIAGVPQLYAEEVAAMLTVLNEDLHNGQYGVHISTTLLQIHGQLLNKAHPKPGT